MSLFTSLGDQDEHLDWSLANYQLLLTSLVFVAAHAPNSFVQLNMQAIYLISSKGFDEKQVGKFFFAFGMSQFLCMAPAGYFLDYSNRKIEWVSYTSVAIAILTVLSTMAAQQGGEDMGVMLILGIMQGGLTAILPPGFNGITMGIVGSKGFTHQVSRNRLMNHLGTALVVAAGSLLAYYYYPNLSALFVVSPLAAIGVWYHLSLVQPDHVHQDAARGLIFESPTMDQYELADELASCKQKATSMPNYGFDDVSDSDTSSSGRYHNHDETGTNTIPDTDDGPSSSSYSPPDFLSSGLEPPAAAYAVPPPPTTQPYHQQHVPAHTIVQPRSSRRMLPPNSDPPPRSDESVPSFNFGFNIAESESNVGGSNGVRTPLSVLINPRTIIFSIIILLFNLANSSVLPLVMQSLALSDPESGILLSGMCIFIAQGCMAFFAKLCGDYSPYWGRKNLFLLGLISLSLRCFLLTCLLSAEESIASQQGVHVLKTLILSTQFLDSVGAGIIGTLQILVTADLAGGTGRFSLLLGVTTGCMCLGSTVSGYLGQSLAQDFGYPFAFTALGIISLAPFTLYIFFMPETLPDCARPQPTSTKRRRKRLREILRRFNEQRRRLMASAATKFRRRPPPVDTTTTPSMVSSSHTNLDAPPSTHRSRPDMELV